MMEAIGFDFEHGRLDVSHHPFCGGVPTDVRMTTRYTTGEFLSSLMGIVHETGHGLYEQGLPKDWSHWAVGAARGMSIHESQSLFVEKQIARSAEFWEWAIRMESVALPHSPLSPAPLAHLEASPPPQYIPTAPYAPRSLIWFPNCFLLFSGHSLGRSLLYDPAG